MQTEYLNLIDSYREEMTEMLSELVQIRSVEGVPEETAEKGLMPFGAGVQAALEYMLDKAKQDGFDTENVDNYGGHIEFGGYTLSADGEITGTSDEVMGILGHLDVVPEGTGWDLDPYSGKIEDGKVFGRGSEDDKGPVLAAYYAMKALKNSGFAPEKKVRLILGLDEETNWKGMDYYFSKVAPPSFGFTPDADFPAIHGEKGILVFQLAKKFSKSVGKGLELRSMSGGSAPNMVADHARAVVRDSSTRSAEVYADLRARAAAYREETGRKITVRGIGKNLEITAAGVSAHGAVPWKGENAISILADFLGGFSFVNEDASEFLEFYNRCIGFETDGTSLGCGLSDEPSGKLVLNVGMIELSPESASVTINVRYPVTLSAEDVYETLSPVLREYDLGVVKGKSQDPVYMPADSPLITTLMEVYREHTGDTESKPLIIGGGTYARACSGIVAFGPLFPGDPASAHQKNEWVAVDKLVLAAKIYADAIARLCAPEA